MVRMVQEPALCYSGQLSLQRLPLWLLVLVSVLQCSEPVIDPLISLGCCLGSLFCLVMGQNLRLGDCQV